MSKVVANKSSYRSNQAESPSLNLGAVNMGVQHQVTNPGSNRWNLYRVVYDNRPVIVCLLHCAPGFQVGMLTALFDNLSIYHNGSTGPCYVLHCSAADTLGCPSHTVHASSRVLLFSQVGVLITLGRPLTTAGRFVALVVTLIVMLPARITGVVNSSVLLQLSVSPTITRAGNGTPGPHWRTGRICMPVVLELVWTVALTACRCTLPLLMSCTAYATVSPVWSRIVLRTTLTTGRSWLTEQK